MVGATLPRSAFVEEQSVNRNEQLQTLIQLYKSETGVKAFDCDAIADWAMRRGATMPKPKTPREIFAIQLADAARAEYRVDAKTGLSYRANHAVRQRQNDGRQFTLWVDMEDATRPQMEYSLTSRRQGMVADAVHLKIDELVWNSKHPEEQPIQLVMDLTFDVEERLNSPDFDSGEQAA
jgi:hypothetical protein